MTTILKVENLHVYFHVEGQDLKAVRGVSFLIRRGETLGLVGESGCGKTITALALMRLVPLPGRIELGEISLMDPEGGERNLLSLPERKMRALRGKELAMIFQEPMTSLNPVYTVGDQIIEAIQVHEPVSKKEALAMAVQLLREVNIPQPEVRIKDYPHQLSGGQRQRVMIAMALSCRPALLIADEPTTALDVTVQARILRLIARLREENKMSVLLVTHDLGVVAQETDRLVVMYMGRIVEAATTRELFARPLHPYTRLLLESVPRLGEDKERLNTIRGNVPTLSNIPTGCSFHPR
ncbi:MAG: ABC transporter ATP-binding protein, partial [Candidatus Auribacterota bacterium]|nr:ABC transporter ATP-binding protein [Candidatus Auribacterota bacterium]